MRRVLLLSYRYAEADANTIRHQSLVRYLRDNDVLVDIVGKTELKNKLEDGITYTQVSRFRDFSFSKLILFFRLFFCHLYLISNNGIKLYVQYVAEAAYAYEIIRKLFKKNKYDACLVGIVPSEFYLIVSLIKNKCWTVLDISDPLYKNAFFDKEGHPSNKKIESKALTCADRIIVMNEMTIKLYTEEMGIDANKMVYLPPATDSSGYVRDKSFHYSIDKNIHMIYSGTLYNNYRDLCEVEKALEMTHHIKLDVVTKPGFVDKKKIHYHKWMSHKDIVSAYQNYDLLLFVDNFYGYQVPSKIFELIATNKPVLFVYDQRNVYLYNLLKDQKGIYFVENNHLKIKDILEKIQKEKSLEVHYTIDLYPYSQNYINEKIMKELFLN